MVSEEVVPEIIPDNLVRGAGSAEGVCNDFQVFLQRFFSVHIHTKTSYFITKAYTLSTSLID